uniref:7TM_GPCR_Srx domain-containing protein n=1 Tax=Parastrongyloides trichosuri TaxID=131310 RepID=A0A0N4ZY45_PARTI
MDTETPIGKVLQVIVTEELFNYTTDFSSDSGADLKDEIEIALDIHLLVGFSYIAIGSFFLCLQMSQTMVFNLTYDDDVTIPEINEDNHNVWIGLSYIILTSTFMFFQIITFYAFYKNRETMTSTPYRVMTHLGIFDLLQQSCHFLSGFFTVFKYEPLKIFNHIISSILQSSYMTSVAMLLLLALNRFDVFYDLKFIPVFNKRKAFLLGIIICYIWFGGLFIFYMFPENQLEYVLINYSWNYVGVSNLGFQLENKSVLIMLVISFISYISIIGKIMKMRCLTSNKTFITITDIKLLFQAILNFVTVLLLELCWSILSGIVYDPNVAIITISYLFILVSGNNTLLNILLIKEVKREVYNLFTFNHFNGVKITKTNGRLIIVGNNKIKAVTD